MHTGGRGISTLYQCGKRSCADIALKCFGVHVELVICVRSDVCDSSWVAFVVAKNGARILHFVRSAQHSTAHSA